MAAAGHPRKTARYPQDGAMEYTCAACHQTFKYAWSDEEAKKELEQKFGIPVEECGIVCDDCYKKMGL
jgi:hypothetical protein